jgi:tetratricopeptide (TPR) repeat protein
MITKNNFMRMYPVLLPAAAILLLSILLISCDLVDPTEVENPEVTDESLIGEVRSTQAALQGTRFRFSAFIANAAYFTDVVSDNYDNVATFISPDADNPRAMRSSDLTLNGFNSIYHQGQRLRAQATFGIEEVAPNDPSPGVTPPMIAEMRFLRAMGNLIQAENFSYVPVEENGPALPADDLVGLAIDELNAVLNDAAAPSNIRTAAQYALARAYRLQGDQASAVSAANAALGIDDEYVFLAQYDTDNLTNTGYVFAVQRALNDIQPLPRLDYLDPKYTRMNSPIPVLKSEEAYLILAEAAIAGGNYTSARNYMKAAVNLAMSEAGLRSVVNFTDSDPRSGRPNSADLQVRADANSDAREGLILPRAGNTIEVHTVSNTSIRDEYIDNLADTREEFLRMLYLLRQEIFFFEGRRMSDLGIRLPITLREIETNQTLAAGNPGTTPVVPDYIPMGTGLDAFQVEDGIVTIQYDMNRILAQNNVSAF